MSRTGAFSLQLRLEGLLSRQLVDFFGSPEALRGRHVRGGARPGARADAGLRQGCDLLALLGQSGGIASGVRVAGLAARTRGTIAVVLVLATGRVLTFARAADRSRCVGGG